MSALSEIEPDEFLSKLQAAFDRMPVEDWSGRRAVVALSGGLDSTVLLHALARLQLPATLAAIHVDHGLHTDSADWAAHCARLAASLEIQYSSIRVDVAQGDGRSLEAVAREARYQAFADSLQTGDVLLTAHHGDDQLETVLLRLLRGTGVRGLTAIHAFASLNSAFIARPLLEFARSELQVKAMEWQLKWLEDPSNLDLRFDRNFLHSQILPQMIERWPAAHRVSTRLARQMSEAETLLGDLASLDLAAVHEPGCIPVAVLTSLSDARLHNVLRHAIRTLELPVPSAAQLGEIRQALAAREDAEVLVSWSGAEARIYRDHLYLMAPLPTARAGWWRCWSRLAIGSVRDSRCSDSSRNQQRDAIDERWGRGHTTHPADARFCSGRGRAGDALALAPRRR